MGFKDLFIKRTEEEQQLSSNGSTNTAPIPSGQYQPPQPRVNIPEPTISSDSMTSAKPDQGIIDNFWNVILRGNLPGPDYLELKNMAAGLKKRIPGEREQFEAAFDVIKMTSPEFSKMVILDSIKKYLEIVESEKKKALDQLDLKRKERVGLKEKEALDYQKKCEDIDERIKELQNTKNDYQNHIQNLNREITEATQDLNLQEEVFNLSVSKVIERLNIDNDIIKSSSDIQ